jgi:ParB-like chromosome segregation protein Spo0J
METMKKFSGKPETDGSARAFSLINADDLCSIEIHPIANIFPTMAEGEFAALRDDIATHGQHEPIWLFDGSVIDGRHRLRACLALGIDAQARTYSGADPVGFIVSLNLHRRHLNESQRGMVAAKLAELPVGANQHAQICAPSQTAAAELLNVSRRTVQSAAKVNASGAPELAQAVEQGAVSVSAAATIATLPVEQQGAIVSGGSGEIRKAAAEIRGAKTKEPAHSEVDVLREALQEAQGNAAMLAEELEAYRAVEAGEHLQEIRQLQTLNRTLSSQLDDYINQNQQLKKQVKTLQRQAGGSHA